MPLVGCYSMIVSESLSSTAGAVPLLPHGRRLGVGALVGSEWS